jgi:FKBP-type peptidyl-prolyl cis-trans isomerase FkpA
MKKLLALVLLAGLTTACSNTILGLGDPSDPAAEEFASSLGINLSAFTKLETGVYIQDDITGTGAVVAAEDTVVVNWTGHIKDGTRFDGANGTTFPLSGVVPGFRFGIVGMRVGGTRRMIIPSALGYGTIRQGIIPPNSTLIFTVQLIRVGKPAGSEPGT